MTYALKENYSLSKDYFSKLLSILRDSEETNPAITLLVLKKYSILLRLMGSYEELSAVLEELFFMNFANLSYSSLGFLPTIKNLFIHYSKFDLKKVAKNKPILRFFIYEGNRLDRDDLRGKWEKSHPRRPFTRNLPTNRGISSCFHDKNQKK